MLPIRKRVTIRPTRVCGFKAIRIPKTCGVQGRIDARRPSRVEENPQNEGRRRQQRQKIAGRPHARELAYNSGELTCLNINCHGCVDVVLYRDSRDAAAADRSCAGPVIDESVKHAHNNTHTHTHTYTHVHTHTAVMMSQESDSRIKIDNNNNAFQAFFFFGKQTTSLTRESRLDHRHHSNSRPGGELKATVCAVSSLPQTMYVHVDEPARPLAPATRARSGCHSPTA